MRDLRPAVALSIRPRIAGVVSDAGAAEIELAGTGGHHRKTPATSLPGKSGLVTSNRRRS